MRVMAVISQNTLSFVQLSQSTHFVLVAEYSQNFPMLMD